MKQTEVFQQLEKAIIKTLTDQTWDPEDIKITKDTNWDDIGLDSLDKLEIQMSLEHSLNINIPNIDFNKFFEGTVNDSVNIIMKLLEPFE